MDDNYIDFLIDLAIKEDIGEGDHTSLSTIPSDAIGKAQLLVKEAGILAGMDIAERVFHRIDPSINIIRFLNDGDEVQKGDIAFEVSGPVISLLSAERLVLNFMQRMSGIATATQQAVKLITGTKTQILDTRKTTPNMRLFEKYAVVAGGGGNHRMGLYDMILIKDNHVDFAGGIIQAIDACRQYLEAKNLSLPIEIEVRDFDELNLVIQYGGVHRIMLDNFSPEDLKTAVSIIQGRFETEASGGITLDNLRSYAEAGVDYISMGSLTHHIKSLDLSLKAVT